jgi:hypothetical protein
MKIIKLTVSNFLGLAMVSYSKLGKVNYFRGKNGVGKTSVLEAIKEGFVSSGVDPDLIRCESKKAEILIELDNKMLINRQITRSENKVNVTIDGQPVNKPQTFLDALLGKNAFNFNPTAYYLAPEKERNRIILSAVHFTLDRDYFLKTIKEMGIDVNALNFDLAKYDFVGEHGLTLLDKIRKDVFEYRHTQGVETTRVKKAIEQDERDMPDTFNSDRFKNFDITKKMADLREATALNNEHEKDELSIKNLREQKQSILADIAATEARLKILKDNLEKVTAQGLSMKAKIDAFVAPDMTSINADISDYDKFRKHIIKQEEISKRKAALLIADFKYKALDDFCDKITNDIPKKVLSQIELPVKGLEFKQDNIFINGVQIDKLSGSESLSLAIDLARKLSGDLKVICIDGWEKMDGDARKLFEEKTKGDGFEYFITEVDHNGNGDGLKLEIKEEDITDNAPAKVAAGDDF